MTMKIDEDIMNVAKEAIAAFEKLSPQEQSTHRQKQRESYARGMSTPCEHGVLDFEQCAECRKHVTEIERLTAEVKEHKDAKWKVQHVDTMNDMVSMGMARDEALDDVARLTAENDRLLTLYNEAMAEMNKSLSDVSRLTRERDEAIKVAAVSSKVFYRIEQLVEEARNKALGEALDAVGFATFEYQSEEYPEDAVEALCLARSKILALKTKEKTDEASK